MVFVAAGLLVWSVSITDADTQRHVRFAAAGCLLAAGVWIVVVLAPRLL